MKVVLTHGYFIHEDEKEQKIMRPYPPLGLLYITTYLRTQGIDASVFDTTFSSRKELLEFVENEKPDILAMYTNLMTKVNVISVLSEISERLPNCIKVLGGPDVTYNTENYLDNGADILVIGEGESTMTELVRGYEEGDPDLNKIDGLAFKNSDGQLVRTNSRQKLRNVDDLPFPDRSLIDISKYMTAWKDFHGTSALNVNTQRGCPYTCKWCSTAVYGQSYRRRSPENVVEELKEITAKYNPDSIWFVDDVFTVSHVWLRKFAAALKEAGLRIRYECISRADRMNEEVVQLLKESGCFRIWIGAESGSQKIIDAMDRRVDVEKVGQMIRLSKFSGIETGTFIMLGYPGETEQDIRATIDHLKKSNPDHFTITVAYPIKGTDLYEEINQSNLMMNAPDWATSTDRDFDFKRTYSRRYYDLAMSWVVNEVNFHKLKQENFKLKPIITTKAKSLISRFRMKLAKS